MACIFGDGHLSTATAALQVLATNRYSFVPPCFPAGIGRKTEEEHKANTLGSTGPRCQLQEEGSPGDQGDPRIR
jgi:hypothetical protein